MPKSLLLLVLLLVSIAHSSVVKAATMTFDRSQWMTGDMNEQSPADSNGTNPNSHVDHFYYYERIAMCMSVIDDSLSDGSPARTYDSVILAMVVASEGLMDSDSMRLFGKRLTRNWSENGTSWTYFHASPDSSWTTAGGDIDGQPCTDTLIIDVTVAAYDTLYFHLDTGFVRHLVEQDNFGWLMMAENIVDRAIFQFYTEDTGTEAYRPTLMVYYSDGTPEAVLAGRRRRSSDTGGNSR